MMEYLVDKILAIVYVVHIAWALCFIIPDIAEKVSDQCSNTWYCARFSRLAGLGYTVDLADGQWRDFRQSLVLLMLTAFGTSFATYLVRWFVANLYPGNRKLLVWCTSTLRALVGVIILFVQHGYHGVVVLIIALVGFQITRLTRNHKLQFGLTWAYAIFILLFKESYRLKHLSGFQYLTPLFDRRYGGMYGWQLPANFLVLRIISYSCDYYWAVERATKNQTAKDSTNSPPTPNDLSLISSRPLQEYTRLNYVAYVLYAPLYMAGPVITFDNFMGCTASTASSSGTTSPTTITCTDAATATVTGTATTDDGALSLKPPHGENVLLYLVRWAGCLALMEYLLHKYPFFAVASSGLINHLTAAQTAIVCYLLLKVMWMKFLLIWRFFRLWALLEGITPPENMTRCMSNNHSLEHFWKGWHSSFNKWIVRYLYKPLGGRERQVRSVWVIFLFVALWHDMEVKLLLWGLLNAFFYVVEVTIKKAVVYSKVLERLPVFVQDLVCAMAGASYIIVLIGVNLVGYGVGVGGVSNIIAKFATTEGLQTVGCCFYFLTIAVLMMQVLKKNGWSTAG